MSVLSSSPWSLRTSRRGSSRREVTLPCQAVRENDFTLIADRSCDLSIEGMLLPLRRPALTGDALIVSFQIPGMWIDCEATVARIVHGRRPSDEGPAVGLRFERMPPAARAALDGFLHGRRSPLPRRGPLARLRRGQIPPQLADETAMASPLADLADIEDDDAIDGLGIFRAVIGAWQGLGAVDVG